jgi:hypothetical protein
MMPEAQVAIIRPLTIGERNRAEVERSGFINVGGQRIEKRTAARDYMLLEEVARSKGEFVPAWHADAQSALETTTGRTYYLREPVEEFASRAPHLVVLNGDPASVRDATRQRQDAQGRSQLSIAQRPATEALLRLQGPTQPAKTPS